MGLGAMWLPLRVRDCALCAVLALLMLFVLQCALEQFYSGKFHCSCKRTCVIDRAVGCGAIAPHKLS